MQVDDYDPEFDDSDSEQAKPKPRASVPKKKTDLPDTISFKSATTANVKKAKMATEKNRKKVVRKVRK